MKARAIAAVRLALELLRAVLVDLIGLAGYALVLTGVGHLWGRGWVYIAAGAPLALAYAWREVVAARPRRRKKGG
jgi:hypothetical protein